MNFLEKNLEDIIFNTPNHLLIERGLHIGGAKKMQVRIGNYGIADIITYDKGELIDYDGKRWHGETCITVYELKQQEINASALLQAIRYAKGVQRYLQKHKGKHYEVKVCLIGSSIEQGSGFPYLSDFMSDFMSVYTYKYDFDGISFNWEYGYHLINEGF